MDQGVTTVEVGTASGRASGAEVVQQVVNRLDDILEWAQREGNRIGYFAAVYRRVTVTLQSALGSGTFDNPERMAALDQMFAGRFFTALEQHQRGEMPTRSWQAAFDAASRPDLAVLQHLLIGIYAHIKLDLGVSAAAVAPGNQLEPLRHDFDVINELLDSLVPLERALVEADSERIHLVDRFGRLGTAAIDEWIKRAREGAWSVAQRMAGLSGAELDRAIADLDAEVAAHSLHVLDPVEPVRLLVKVARGAEPDDVATIIRSLV